jgi:hypothetical protein
VGWGGAPVELLELQQELDFLQEQELELEKEVEQEERKPLQ